MSDQARSDAVYKAHDWAIEPYVGVGPIRFGMSPAQVAEVLGQPVVENKRVRGSLAFYEMPAKKLPVVIFESRKVALIDFTHFAKKLRLGDIYLFKEKRQPIIDKLIERSTCVFENFEGYDFLDFGVSLSNARNFRDQKNIGAYRRGYFDELIARQTGGGRGRYIKGGPG